MSNLTQEIELLKTKELVYKDSKNGSGFVKLEDAIRALERLHANLNKK